MRTIKTDGRGVGVAAAAAVTTEDMATVKLQKGPHRAEARILHLRYHFGNNKLKYRTRTTMRMPYILELSSKGCIPFIARA